MHRRGHEAPPNRRVPNTGGHCRATTRPANSRGWRALRPIPTRATTPGASPPAAPRRRVVRGKFSSRQIERIALPPSSWPASVPAIHASRAPKEGADARSRSAHDNLSSQIGPGRGSGRTPRVRRPPVTAVPPWLVPSDPVLSAGAAACSASGPL